MILKGHIKNQEKKRERSVAVESGKLDQAHDT
jgi:hypothetical protein